MDSSEFFAEHDRLLLGRIVNASLYEMEELARLAGVTDDAVSHALVNVIVTFAKAKIMKELEKKTEDMLYWVERAI